MSVLDTDRPPQLPTDRVAAELRAWITAGEWAADEQLPSVATLAGQHNTSRATMSRAIQRLADEGLLRADRIQTCTGRIYLGLARRLASFPLSPHRVLSLTVTRPSGRVELRPELHRCGSCLSLGLLECTLTFRDFLTGSVRSWRP